MLLARGTRVRARKHRSSTTGCVVAKNRTHRRASRPAASAAHNIPSCSLLVPELRPRGGRPETDMEKIGRQRQSAVPRRRRAPLRQRRVPTWLNQRTGLPGSRPHCHQALLRPPRRGRCPAPAAQGPVRTRPAGMCGNSTSRASTRAVAPRWGRRLAWELCPSPAKPAGPPRPPRVDSRRVEPIVGRRGSSSCEMRGKPRCWQHRGPPSETTHRSPV